MYNIIKISENKVVKTTHSSNKATRWINDRINPSDFRKELISETTNKTPEEMKTTENNILIAEFMGLNFEQGQERLFVNGLGTKLINETFNSNWNWLMQVVEKIEGLNYDVIILHSSTEITSCDIDFQTIFGNSETYSKKEAVYNACIEFIKWYNEQKN